MEPVITAGNDCLVSITVPIKDGMDVFAIGTRLQKAFMKYSDDVNVEFPYKNGVSYAGVIINKSISRMCVELPDIVKLMDDTLHEDEVDKKLYRLSYKGYIYKHDTPLHDLSANGVQNMFDNIMKSQVKAVVDIENEERNETLRTYVSYEKERMLDDMFNGIRNRASGNKVYSFYSNSLIVSIGDKDITDAFKEPEHPLLQGNWFTMDKKYVENITKRGSYFVKHEKENLREWTPLVTRQIKNGEDEFYQIGTGLLLDGKTSTMYFDGKMSLKNLVYVADTISFNLRKSDIDLPKTKILQDFMVNAKEIKLEKVQSVDLSSDNVKKRENTRMF